MEGSVPLMLSFAQQPPPWPWHLNGSVLQRQTRSFPIMHQHTDRCTTTHRQRCRSLSASLPEPASSKFGSRDYWDTFYQQSSSNFSWYSGWADLAPFVEEVVGREDRVLIAGVGNDLAIVDMYDAGFTNMVAFDYAPEGVRAARAMFGEDRLAPIGTAELLVADARALLDFPDQAFDAVLEKGTLDAIYLSGGSDKELGAQHLQMAVDELARVLKPRGTLVSITAACVDAVQAAVSSKDWNVIQDGSIYLTEEGYASNQVDGTLLVWERKIG